MTEDLHVFVIDDDPEVIRSLGLLLRANGYVVEGYESATALLERREFDLLACLVLDLRLGAQSGLDVQEELRRRGFWQPIVFLSGQSDVPLTAKAMRDGALDFLVKPVDEPELLNAMARARTQALTLLEKRLAGRDAVARLARLTARERQVCDLIARGVLNKQIAYELSSSENTIKVHRARVMRKLNVDSVAALVRLIADWGAASRSPHQILQRPRTEQLD